LAAHRDAPETKKETTSSLMEKSALKKVFIVGCQRSGTSVVQATIARVAKLYTVQETHFFVHLLGGQDQWIYNEEARYQRKWRSRLALMRGRTYSELRQDMSELLDDPSLKLRLRPRLTGVSYIPEFLRLLDAAARHYQTAGWLEKTPAHLPYIDLIQQHIPDAHFIHVVRSGEDVVASIIDGELKYFERRLFFGGVGYAVRQWNRAVETHLAHAGKPGHLIVRHEDFVADPVQTLRRTLQFIGLPSDSIDTSPASAPTEAEIAEAPWKKHWLSESVTSQQRKFETLFGPQMQTWLREHLTDYAKFSEALHKRTAPSSVRAS
jgi:hypothetical protein